MTLKLKKCVFARNRLRYIGHEVGMGFRSPVMEKVDAIKNIEEPKTKKLLRSFLGMTGFFRQYLKNYADVVFPLTELTKKRFSNTIKFNDEQRRAFETVKQMLCDYTKLYAPDYSKPFIIRTDSSDYAVGCSLSQVDGDNIESPIAFASQKLSESQRKMSTIERESYGVIFALRRFEPYVFLSKIQIFSDHSPLSYIVSNASVSPKLARWALSLSKYDLTLKHLSGSENKVADALSRC